MTSDQKKSGIWAVLFVAAIIVSGVTILNLNDRNQTLSRSNSDQIIEFNTLPYTPHEAEELLKQYNITQSSFESAHIFNATRTIVAQVGIEYFIQYFHDPTVGKANWSNNTHVSYEYDIEVGNYSTSKTVFLYFYPNYIRENGVPKKGNLQPFSVTAEEAKSIALKAGLPYGSLDPEVSMVYQAYEDYSPNFGYGEKYVWKVRSWTSPLWSNPIKKKTAYVDPLSGRVYAIQSGGLSRYEEDVDTLEEAQSLGLDGYVKLNYSQLPKRINLTSSEDLSFQLQIEYISHVEDRKEVKVSVDPQNTDTFWIQTNIGDKLRDYLSYEPQGDFLIGAGESVNISCTLHLPDNIQGFSFNKRSLRGLGIGAENTLIVHNLDS